MADTIDFKKLITVPGLIWLGNGDGHLVAGKQIFLVIDTVRVQALVYGIVDFVIKTENEFKVAIATEDGKFYKFSLVEQFNGASEQLSTEDKNRYRVFYDGDSARDYLYSLNFIYHSKMECMVDRLRIEAKKRRL